MEIVFVLLFVGALYWYFTHKEKFQKSSNLQNLSSASKGHDLSQFSHLPERFVVFDLETTGLNASRNRIIEIGAIRVNLYSNQHETYQCLIKGGRKLSKKIVDLTGITDQMLEEEGISLEEAMKGFKDFVGDLRLVAFNAPFDMAFLKKSGDACGLEFLNPTSCALRMARRAWPNRQGYRLIDLARDGNVTLKNEHRALGDCERTLAVYIGAATTLRSVD